MGKNGYEHGYSVAFALDIVMNYFATTSMIMSSLLRDCFYKFVTRINLYSEIQDFFIAS